MKIWILDCDVNKYENLKWREEFNLSVIQSFNGQKINNWNPIKVERMYNREFSNTPGFSPHIPVFDEKAKNALKNILNNKVEFLPLDCENNSFFAVNVINILDCIDYNKSVYKTFSDRKRIMRFIKYSFIEKKINAQHIFKIIDEPLKRPFVSDEFKNIVEENNLTGFIFKLAWDSEEI